MAEYEFRIPPQVAILRMVGAGVLIFFVVIIAFGSLRTIGPGEKGVVFSQFGGVKSITLEEGLHFQIPFIERITPVDVRVQKAQSEATAASRDLQTVQSVIAVNFHVDPSAVPKIYQQIGTAYKERVIDPAVQEAIKQATAQFTAEELITRRAEVKDLITQSLAERLLRFNIILDEFSIMDFQFSREFNTAIEAKQTAEQNALKAKRDLDRIKIEAEQKITQAKAEAESQRLQRATINPMLLQLRAIEKWDGHLPSVSGGAMPFIDVSSLKPKQ